jgi:hypothetical protein
MRSEWVLLSCLAAVTVAGSLRAAEIGTTIDISADTLRDKIRGGVVGEIFGDLNGLPHEMKYIDAPGNVERYVPSLPEGAWTDDDTDIEWVHHFEMDRAGVTLVPYPRVAELWKAHINRRIWTANAYARRLMDLGIEPPLTGRIAINPVAVFNISGEFCAESFGLCAPAMPRAASRIGLHYTHVTIDGEPAQQTQFFDTIIATAFVESDVDKLLDAGVAALDPASQLVRVVSDTRAWHAAHAAHADWRETRRLIHDKYTLHRNELPDRNGYHLNTAAVVAALLYGNGDFAETVRMTFNFGWDADYTAATAGTIVGTIKGGHWFDQRIKSDGWTLKDVYRNTCRDGMPIDEAITAYAERIYRIARRVIREQGGSEIGSGAQLAFRIPRETPSNVEPLPRPLDRLDELKRELLPRIDKELAGPTPVERARAAYLAICLGEAPRLAHERKDHWQPAVVELEKHQGLINALYDAPPTVATAFQARFRAAGIEPSKGELIKPAATSQAK